MSNQRDIIALIKAISGQANVLTIPRLYLKLTKSHRAALLLSQCVYWSDKTKDPDGWFYKTFADWRDELGMPRGAVETAMKSISLWVETKVRRVGGHPKTHYRINLEVLESSISNMLESSISNMLESSTLEVSDSSTFKVLENSESTIHRLPTEITTQRSRETPPREPSEVYAIALSLSEVCKMDMRANKGRLLREAKLILTATPHPTPDLILANYNGDPGAFWKSTDWRGKKGNLPTPASIRETWGQWTNQTTGSTQAAIMTLADTEAAFRRDNPGKPLPKLG